MSVLRMTFKTPDLTEDSLNELLQEHMRTVTIEDEEEREIAEDEKRDSWQSIINKFVIAEL